MTVQGWHAPAVNTSKHSSLFCQADLAYEAVMAAKVSEEYGRRGGTPRILFGFIYPGTPIQTWGKPSLEVKCFIFQLLLLIYFDLTKYETFILINSSIFLIYV